MITLFFSLQNKQFMLISCMKFFVAKNYFMYACIPVTAHALVSIWKSIGIAVYIACFDSVVGSKPESPIKPCLP